MAETLKIEIELVGGAQVGGNGSEAGIKGDTAKGNAETFFKLDRAMAVSKQFANQIVGASVNSIGSRTGNYVLQDRAQQGINVAKKLIGIGVSFALNPVLGTINVVSEGIGAAFEYAAYAREIRWQNREAGELARRAGYLTDNRNIGR